MYDLDITSFMSRLLPIYSAIPLRYFITFSCLAEFVRILAFVYLFGVSLQTLRLSCIRTLCKRSLRVSLGERHCKIYRRMLLSLKHLNSVAGTFLLTTIVATFVLIVCFGYCSIALHSELSVLITLVSIFSVTCLMGTVLWLLHVEMMCYENSTECLRNFKLNAASMGSGRGVWKKRVNCLAPFKFYPSIGSMELFYIKRSTVISYLEMVVSYIVNAVVGL
jgi:hypothetical protein